MGVFRIIDIEFPSPGGDYGLSDGVRSISCSREEESFRPLAGITVFRTVSNWLRDLDVTKVSVPWRGLRSFGPR